MKSNPARNPASGKADRPDPAASAAPDASPDSSPDSSSGSSSPAEPDPPESASDRRKRRALFLRELAEARELRARVQPRRTKERRMREAMRMRTFRI